MNATEQRITAAAIRLFAERGSLELTVSELATEAGVARGTLYRKVPSMEQLFQKVIQHTATQLHARVAASLDRSAITDPAARLATGLRLLTRLVHDDPVMGKFIIRFAMTEESLHAALAGPPVEDLTAGIASGRYTITEPMLMNVTAFMGGATLSALWMVVEGHQGWREAGTVAAKLLLRAFGIPPEEARELASTELPALAEGEPSAYCPKPT